MSAHNHLTVKKPAHPILKRLGETIRLLRLRNGHSQEALAELAGIDRSYMSGIERGLRNISVLHAVKLSNALRVPLHELLQPSATRLGLDDVGHLGVLRERHVHVGADELAQALHLTGPQSLLIRRDTRGDSGKLVDWTVGQSVSLG